MSASILLGLGANLGDPPRQLTRAVARLREIVRIDAVSSIYRTEPVGIRDQPDFYNLVCRGETDLAPEALHAKLQEIERALGRRRDVPGGPRTIDIDLLAYGDSVRESPGLVVPHPRLHLRAFVLVPLAEIAPEWRHPRLGRTPSALLARLAHPEAVRRHGPPPLPGADSRPSG